MIRIDMEMPKSCHECPFCMSFYNGCLLMPSVPAWIKDVMESQDKRSEHCPLIEELEVSVKNGNGKAL